MTKPIKVLLIRFSSFGDVLQTLSVPSRLKDLESQTGRPVEIHWLTRSEFKSLIENHPDVTQVWPLNKRDGLSGLITLIIELSKLDFEYIYDAHANLRSFIVSFLLGFWFPLFKQQRLPRKARKSQKRWKRFLLFKFRINKFEMPFSGQRDLLEPLMKWGLSKLAPSAPQLFLPKTEAHLKIPAHFGEFVALAPSAAHALKRWPIEYWIQLVQLMPKAKFVCLGGPEDIFIEQICNVDPNRILNLAGKLSLIESASVVSISKTLVANDTGLLHVAEQLGKPAIALMGPAPFGFPSRATTHILEKNLNCRPCSKHGQGPCHNPIFHECMRSIRPIEVAQILKERHQLGVD